MDFNLEIQKYKLSVIKIEDLFKKRRMDPDKEFEHIRNQKLIHKILSRVKGEDTSEQEVRNTIKWVEKISKYVPIASENELEEIIKIMVLLSQERAKLNELYDYPGLNLMKRVRECMIRYMVVLSEIRARQKEFLEHWFSDEHWIAEWSHILLDLSQESKMTKYGFENVKARDFLFLLELELATADDASKLEKPMIRLQPIKNKESFLIIPTQAASEEFEVQVNRVLNNNLTFTEWVRETLRGFKLP